MEPDRQTTSVETTPEGQIRIRYEWISSGVDMSSEFVLEAAAVEWVAESISRAATDELSKAEATMGPDVFSVYIGGGQRYDDINVNISNRRDLTMIYGKLYVLTGMEREVALNLADQIRKIAAAK